jgi:hypothetical protein
MAALEASEWSATTDIVYCRVQFPDLAWCGWSQVLLHTWKMVFRVSGSIKYAFTFLSLIPPRPD